MYRIWLFQMKKTVYNRSSNFYCVQKECNKYRCLSSLVLYHRTRTKVSRLLYNFVVSLPQNVMDLSPYVIPKGIRSFCHTDSLSVGFALFPVFQAFVSYSVPSLKFSMPRLGYALMCPCPTFGFSFFLLRRGRGV